MARWVAWLRGVNVGKAGAGRKAVPMAELRALAAELGWRGAQTYIQSGNLVFEARGSAASLARALEDAIVSRWGFEVPAVLVPVARLDDHAVWPHLADGMLPPQRGPAPQ